MRSILDSKKGAEMTITTIIVIVLVLVVLIVVIVGFTSGWANLRDKIFGFLTKANTDTIVQACQTACSTNSVNDYCTMKRTVVFADTRDKNKTKEYTCKILESEQIGLELCTNIDCSEVLKTCAQLGGEWYNSTSATKQLVSGNCPPTVKINNVDSAVEDVTGRVGEAVDKARIPAGDKCCRVKTA